MKLNRPSDQPGWNKVVDHGSGRGVYVQQGLDVSEKIYRYMAAKDLRATLLSSQLYMSNVRSWTDPYERWWCDQLFRDGSKLADVNAYGMCWTRRKRDEPFWRLYQDRCDHRDGEGKPLPPSVPPVRIKVRISDLVSLFGRVTEQTEAKAFIGEVAYCKETLITERAKALRKSSKEVAIDAASALHLKRSAFWFEQEIRVLWIDRDDRRDAILIDCTPFELIEGLMIGPTLDVAGAKQLKQHMIDLGLPAERIKRSLIYRQPRRPAAPKIS